MLSQILRSITAVALVVTAQVAIPGWSSAAIAGSTNHKGCKTKAHQHGKVAATKVVKPALRSGGGGGAQLRRSPDVQILSYGP